MYWQDMKKRSCKEMDEKRFVMRYGKYIDTVENIEYDEKWESWKIVELLNTLSEENEKLKSKNRGLQSELQIFKEDATHSNLQINKLTDENEQLKQVNRNLGDFRNFITEKNVSNEKQRKELQLQLLRLYNYFENYFEDTMSHNAFSEMWDNVKEDEKWEKK